MLTTPGPPLNRIAATVGRPAGGTTRMRTLTPGRVGRSTTCAAAGQARSSTSAMAASVRMSGPCDPSDDGLHDLAVDAVEAVRRRDRAGIGPRTAAAAEAQHLDTRRAGEQGRQRLRGPQRRAG